MVQSYKHGRAGPGSHAFAGAPFREGLESLHAPRFFRALCDPNRIALLVRLAERGEPCTVSDLGADLPVDLSVVSRHLAVLRDAGILAAEKRGKAVYYSVRFGALAANLGAMAAAIEACCPDDHPCAPRFAATQPMELEKDRR